MGSGGTVEAVIFLLPALLFIAVVILWMLGMPYTLSGLVQVLLVLALIAVVFRALQGRQPFRG